MNRRKYLQWMVHVSLVASCGIVAGCGREKQVVQNEPAPTPTAIPTEIPSPESSPAEPEPDVSPSPEAVPTESAPEEPKAPYGELTANQQDRLNTVMETLADVNTNEAKRWTENLAYDETGGEHELQVWEAIASAYKQWNEDRPGIADVAKQEAFQVLLLGSLLPEKEALRHLKLVSLTPEDARELIALYAAPGLSNDSPSPSASPEA